MHRRDEQTTDVYDNVVKARNGKEITDSTQEQLSESSESLCVKIRSSRAAAVCLVLLCVLLLTAVIVLCVHVLAKSSNYTKETHQLLTNITSLTEERDDLKVKNGHLTNERDQLKIKNGHLINERDQLKLEKNDIQKTLDKLDGWTYFRSSFYFISSEEKNWTESRRYCTERGADLIIINNKDEQEFAKNSSDRVWIGLTDSDVEGRWKWVDGTNTTSLFWASGEPNNHSGDEDCAMTYSSGWADYPCNSAFRGICEKIIFK